MQFVIHKNAGVSTLNIEGELYTHLFKSRRTRQSTTLLVRNLEDFNLYTYEILEIHKKYATLNLVSSTLTPPSNLPKTHLIWAMIEPKNIEKALPTLNELNVKKISFFYAEYSQKNFKLDFERIYRILESSCMQCGRFIKLEIEILKDLQEMCEKYQDFGVLDFGGEALRQGISLPILIGSEGGFSQKEREILKTRQTFSAKNCNILRSESAVIYTASLLA
ncbi:16S rRNA (uracil(1498)-N(3))-methyltransferase [Helicobacter valdiviensis]|uniref:Ribosomal RNA small subunit methyltransferase E n=1 Tax=Helicobacter valdiviensis TaxID=1458358 RepID=A0A2W6MZJ7_9HELI|nr:16S rRNA (uracil(1498)-N(3))-methyltransferase [Helicobacter valdiviensis]PZT48788.1 16S rRNA (uracil(1498)-N(3))-methyltransferase [Helicobacter valdiviensis]